LEKAVSNLINENNDLNKALEKADAEQLNGLASKLAQDAEVIGNASFVGRELKVKNPDMLKKLGFQILNELKGSGLIILTAIINDKPSVVLAIGDILQNERNLDASRIIKEQIAPLIKGGGGGQKNLATAGGQDSSRIAEVIAVVKAIIS
ncbi:MAG: DHHA1 domain-containing protein, partial [Ginsengibacter sp.]